MKLNPDCVRDILITLEDIAQFGTVFTIPFDQLTDFPQLEKYPQNVLTYHMQQCDYSGMFRNFKVNIDCFTFYDLSPEAHEFLANVRSDSVWKKVKDIGNIIGSKSIPAITQIATGVITQIIKNQLGI